NRSSRQAYLTDGSSPTVSNPRARSTHAPAFCLMSYTVTPTILRATAPGAVEQRAQLVVAHRHEGARQRIALDVVLVLAGEPDDGQRRRRERVSQPSGTVAEARGLPSPPRP